jgi:hypothetical protein
LAITAPNDQQALLMTWPTMAQDARALPPCPQNNLHRFPIHIFGETSVTTMTLENQLHEMATEAEADYREAVVVCAAGNGDTLTTAQLRKACEAAMRSPAQMLKDTARVKDRLRLKARLDTEPQLAQQALDEIRAEAAAIREEEDRLNDRIKEIQAAGEALQIRTNLARLRSRNQPQPDQVRRAIELQLTRTATKDTDDAFDPANFLLTGEEREVVEIPEHHAGDGGRRYHVSASMKHSGAQYHEATVWADDPNDAWAKFCDAERWWPSPGVVDRTITEE